MWCHNIFECSSANSRKYLWPNKVSQKICPIEETKGKFPQNLDYHLTKSKREFCSSFEIILKQGLAMSWRLKERTYPMLFYAPPCLQKFLQGTPCSYILYSHTPSCHFLGIGVDTKKTRNTITSYTSIFGAKTQDRKEANFSIYTWLFG